MGWFIGAVMAVLTVASLVIGAISVIATGNTIWIIVWFAGLLSGFANVGCGVTALYKRLS